MKGRAPERAFAAFIESAGIFLIEFHHDAERIDILNRAQSEGSFTNLGEAAQTLARMLRDHQGGGAKIYITLRGMGSAHHILMLPQAKPELLRPVVAREMARLYPDLEQPVVEFCSGEPLDRRARARPEKGSPPQELLAAAIPRVDMEQLIAALEPLGSELMHLTVLPKVLDRVYEEAPTPEAPSAVLMLLAGGPLFGFFYNRELRLIVDPPVDIAAGGVSSQFVIEQLERGNLYLRQQFRGAQISRLLLAAEAEEFGPLSRAIEEALGLTVERFAPQIGSSAAIAAMGAVLDAQSPRSLNLFPTGEKVKKAGERTARRLAIAGVTLLAVIAWWWAANGVSAAVTWRSRIKTLTTAIDRRAAPLAPLTEVVHRRRQIAAQRTALQTVAAERVRLQQLLKGLSLAPQANVAISSFRAERDPSSWTVYVSGNASSYTASDAISSVHMFYRELPSATGATAITLDTFTWGEDTPDGLTRIGFELHYTAPAIDAALLNGVSR